MPPVSTHHRCSVASLSCHSGVVCLVHVRVRVCRGCGLFGFFGGTMHSGRFAEAQSAEARLFMKVLSIGHRGTQVNVALYQGGWLSTALSSWSTLGPCCLKKKTEPEMALPHPSYNEHSSCHVARSPPPREMDSAQRSDTDSMLAQQAAREVEPPSFTRLHQPILTSPAATVQASTSWNSRSCWRRPSRPWRTKWWHCARTLDGCTRSRRWVSGELHILLCRTARYCVTTHPPPMPIHPPCLSVFLCLPLSVL